MSVTLRTARLDHIALKSEAPEALAEFHGRVLRMTVEPDQRTGDFVLRGPQRRLVITRGTGHHLAYAAFGIAVREELEALKRQVESRGISLEPSPSPLFGEEAFSVTDPDGNRMVFGLRQAEDLEGSDLPGRIQHVVCATTDIAPIQAFYTEGLGFRLSDAVVDEEGGDRAVFLRSDSEHHSFAVFKAPSCRLDHHCYEAGDWMAIRDWGDHMAAEHVRLQWGPGRHGPGNNLFFMIHDPDGNWVEISAELDVVPDDKPMGVWTHSERTLNTWGQAFLRS
ncbi:VOC family protein [Rhodospirillum sp. A1_3_36]|uniref:VOC family protein n=1 Tax=Rhodospirillum sp. A1_3_36 TaxID=3391666 RepID=UPI0039A715C4